MEVANLWFGIEQLLEFFGLRRRKGPVSAYRDRKEERTECIVKVDQSAGGDEIAARKRWLI